MARNLPVFYFSACEMLDLRRFADFDDCTVGTFITFSQDVEIRGQGKFRPELAAVPLSCVECEIAVHGETRQPCL
jgi:hypothetical protein